MQNEALPHRATLASAFSSREHADVTSTHFSFLAKGHDPRFLQLAEAAERTLAVDPNSTLRKARQLAEAFAKHAAAAGVWLGPQLAQVDLLRELDRKGYLDRQVLDFFHSLRRGGNAAAHDFTGLHRQAVDSLRIARQLARASSTTPAQARTSRRAP